MSKKTICVLFGGRSSEHEVSCMSAANIIQYLDKERFEVIPVGITKEGNWYLYQGDLEKVRAGAWTQGHNKACILSPDPKHHGLLVFNKNGDTFIQHIDVIIPALHGKNGEDGTVQGLFELSGIPYMGCGVLASSMCMDKVITKKLLQAAGIPVTDGFDLSDFQEGETEAVHNRIIDSVGYPVVVKPSNAGSSVGVSLVKTKEELKPALVLAAANDRKILVEKAVDAREIECAVLGGYHDAKASCPGEIGKSVEMYDYETKYVTDDSEQLVPADLPPEVAEQIRETAVRAFQALDCFGLARVDFFLEKQTGNIMLNEINTLPGFTNISMYPMMWEKSGLSNTALLTRLVELGLARQGSEQVG